MEEGKGGEGIYHKAMFEYQLGSSSEIPKVLKKVRTHLSQPTRPQPDLAWLASFVTSVVIHTFLWDHFKSLFPDDPTSFFNQPAGVKPAKTSGSSPARHHFQ